jgi:magnesium-transporting ATPase (P-type)
MHAHVHTCTQIHTHTYQHFSHSHRLLDMYQGIVLCNDADLLITAQPNNPNSTYKPIGYPTEAALCTLGLKMGITDLKSFKELKPRVAAVPFASEHKFMCTVNSDGPRGASPLIMHVKGAADRVLPFCANQIVNDDVHTHAPLTREFWDDQVSTLSAEGLRVLAVARASWDESSRVSENNLDADVLLQAPAPFLTMVGLVAILDPPREEAILACAKAQHAGIQVKMITGDHPETAVAIAKKLGIVDASLPEDMLVKITGPQLDALTEAELDKFVMTCNVYARASPENKLQIVKSLKRIGQTASMTGDGVNDAPALKAANIGVAMGITGTDVSKEAAEMVLVDENFATIVRAVEEGRRVWDNLVKVLLFSMPTNFAQGFSVFFSYALMMETVPLTAIQVLYVNMITSVTLGLALSMEAAEKNIMERPPRRKGKRLFGRMIAWHSVFVAALLVACVLGVFQYQLNREDTAGSGCASRGSWNDHTCAACTLDGKPVEDPNDDAAISQILPGCPEHCMEAMDLRRRAWRMRASRPLTVLREDMVDMQAFRTQVPSRVASASENTTVPSEDMLHATEWTSTQQPELSLRRKASVEDCDRVKRARAGAFNMLVFGQMTFALNCRFLKETSLNRRLFTGNKWAWISIALVTALQFFLTYTPGVQDFFSFAAIDGQLWGVIFALTVAFFLIVDLGARVWCVCVYVCMYVCMHACMASFGASFLRLLWRFF